MCIDIASMTLNIDACQYIGQDGFMPVAAPLPVIDVTACCAPLVREPLDPDNAEKLARSLKAIADPARLRLISMIAAHAGGEACVCDLTDPIGLSQPTVSHHLKVLVDAGILHREKRATWAYYSIIPGSLDSLANLLVTV
jgi:ArsR family transcriptional regulator, arsenate/arsenite/antimonite-responsive transcriptional repressor